MSSQHPPSPLCHCGCPLTTDEGQDALRPGMCLWCCGCGEQRRGTDDEYARALAADAAWLAQETRGDQPSADAPKGLEDDATLSLFDVDSPEP